MLNAYKIAALRVLLSCYALALFSPFLPHAEYFFNKSYIVRQLCENRKNPALMCEGICYVKKRIVETETAQTKESNPAPADGRGEQFSAHLLLPAEFGTSLQTASPLCFFITLSAPSSPFVTDVFHPPRVESLFL